MKAKSKLKILVLMAAGILCAGMGHEASAQRDVFQIAEVNVNRFNTRHVINTNVTASQIRVCAYNDDLHLQRLAVTLGNGRQFILAQDEYVRARNCTQWKDLRGDERRVVQVLLVGQSDRDNRSTRVVIQGRVDANNFRTWQAWNPSTSCGDSQIPYLKDNRGYLVWTTPCPNRSPSGPVGMSCERAARGAMCYGYSYQATPGFYCEAPIGRTPPNPAYIYNMYICQ